MSADAVIPASLLAYFITNAATDVGRTGDEQLARAAASNQLTDLSDAQYGPLRSNATWNYDPSGPAKR
jgi:hypothetical protein